MAPVQANRWTVIAFLAAVLGALIVVFAPLYTGCTSRSGGTEVCGHASAYTVNGSWIFVVVSVPVLVALIPVLVRRRWARIVSVVLLWLGCLVGLLSVGIFFVPAALLMTIAAARSPSVIPPMPPLPIG